MIQPKAQLSQHMRVGLQRIMSLRAALPLAIGDSRHFAKESGLKAVEVLNRVAKTLKS